MPLQQLKYFDAHLRAASTILSLYDGKLPFNYFLKSYFSQNKKFGSKDRKQITSFCYAALRLGKSFPSSSIEQKIVKGLCLSSADVLRDWNTIHGQYKMPDSAPENIFPFKCYLSDDIDASAFEKSHLVQPDLFLRIRPGHQSSVASKLNTLNAQYTLENDVVRLPSSFKTDSFFKINEELVIQDLSSQRVGELMHLLKSEIKKRNMSVWDCCAASGGKSILAKDILGDIELTVSDKRSSIIANLKKRFTQANIRNYNALICDAANFRPKNKFDLIIADVPCTGSGTWGRTPEQLSYFSDKAISEYVALQKRIINNIVKFIKPDRYILYITCSVFKQENQDQVGFMQHQNLCVVDQKIISGYNSKADTMFCALLKKI